jgi:hypothetical protein
MIATAPGAPTGSDTSEEEQLMTIKGFRSLPTIAAVGLALIAPTRSSEARSFPARGGSSAFHADANCWTPFGPVITNTCSTEKFWYIPLLVDGTNGGLVAVTAQGASPASTVMCRAVGSSKDATFFVIGAWTGLPFFGPAAEIDVNMFVPYPGGGAMIDCDVFPGGKVNMVDW